MGGKESGEVEGPETNRAMLLGLLRLGLLQNLDRAVAFGAPDHAAGGMDRWIGLEYFHLVHVLDARPDSYILSFDASGEGVPAATPRLSLDPVTGLPARRETTLTVDRAPVHVVETYTRFVVE